MGLLFRHSHFDLILFQFKGLADIPGYAQANALIFLNKRLLRSLRFAAYNYEFVLFWAGTTGTF